MACELPLLFNAKNILVEKLMRYYLTMAGGDRVIHTCSQGIQPKLYVIVRLEFGLDFNDVTVP